MFFDGTVASSLRPQRRRTQGSIGRHHDLARPPSLTGGIPVYANAVYYPNWRIYKKQPPSSLRLGYVSHVFYAFAWVKPDGTVYVWHPFTPLSDEWADDQMPVDGTNGCIRAFTQLKPQYSELKILLSIGGGGEAGSGNFAAVASNPVALQRFVESASYLVHRFGVDGLDLDWEHPWNPQQGNDYVNMLAQLRTRLPWPHYLLTTALPAGEWALRNINLFHAQQHLDLINLMAYDFSGPWTALSGHQSQLFTPQMPHDDAALMSGHRGVMYLLSNGVPAKKILLGIPVYGRGFPGANQIGQPWRKRLRERGSSSTGTSTDEGEAEENVEFDYVDLPCAGTVEQHDEIVGAAFCVEDCPGGAGFVTYDSTKTVRQKARFACEMNLAGLFYWHAAADDARGERSLVATGYNALHGF